jgi:hypothetical protein
MLDCSAVLGLENPAKGDALLPWVESRKSVMGSGGSASDETDARRD